jgi:hypothetical protein
MSESRRIAVLGAGIMGASLALFLARRGFDVCLFDRESAPLAGASRWNEGKIHLGYLYAADPSLETARRVIPGGLKFGPLISELIETDIAPHITEQDDFYLVHRESVVGPEAVKATFDRISALLREQSDSPRYLVDVSAARCRQLSRKELANLAHSKTILAGFVAPERSINTQWVADRLGDAIGSERHITFRPQVDITAVTPVDSITGPWRVAGSSPDSPLDERFDIVVNALWHGRLAIDVTAGLPIAPGWSNRLRRSLFITTRTALDLPNAIVAFGPFGDVKSYTATDFYVSWYPTGLACESYAITPPAPRPFGFEQEKRLIAEVQTAIGELLPWTSEIFDSADEVMIRGGYVFAQGRGSLADPRSTLHRRDRFGILRHGQYYSVDTGKYSTAPWLAWCLAKELKGE